MAGASSSVEDGQFRVRYALDRPAARWIPSSLRVLPLRALRARKSSPLTMSPTGRPNLSHCSIQARQLGRPLLGDGRGLGMFGVLDRSAKRHLSTGYSRARASRTGFRSLEARTTALSEQHRNVRALTQLDANDGLLACRISPSSSSAPSIGRSPRRRIGVFQQGHSRPSLCICLGGSHEGRLHAQISRSRSRGRIIPHGPRFASPTRSEIARCSTLRKALLNWLRSVRRGHFWLGCRTALARTGLEFGMERLRAVRLSGSTALAGCCALPDVHPVCHRRSDLLNHCQPRRHGLENSRLFTSIERPTPLAGNL